MRVEFNTGLLRLLFDGNYQKRKNGRPDIDKEIREILK